MADVDRHRAREHRRFISTLRCTVCGRDPPCDPHHLKFAQLRAKNMKSGDQFCVPLCRTHHDQVEGWGREQGFWEHHDIDPMPLAAELWQMSLKAGRAKEEA